MSFGNSRFGGGGGGGAAFKKRDSGGDDDEKEEVVNSKIPLPLYPPRKDLPSLPSNTIESWDLVTKLVRIRNRFEYSIYHLKTDQQSKPDGIDRYSNRFSSANKDSNALEKHLNAEYFPQELTTNRKRSKKKRKIIDMKNFDDIQKQEEEGGEGDGEKKEGEENEEEDEDESDLDDENYGQGGTVSDDEDISDDDEGEKENTF